MSLLTQKQEELLKKRKQLHEFTHGPDGNIKASVEDLPEIERREAEIDALHLETEKLQRLENIVASNDAEVKAARATSDRMTSPAQPGTTTEAAPRGIKAMLQSPGWAAVKAPWGAGKSFNLTADEYEALKATITLTTISPSVPRQPGYVPAAVERRTTVTDLLPVGRMEGPSLQYVTQTAPTNAATTVAEEGTKPEATMAFSTVTEAAATVAVWQPATTQSLEDNPWLEGFIRDVLLWMLGQREEAQIISGNGVGANLTGILNRAGIQTQALGADDRLTAIHKAITKVQVTGFAEPTAIVMHPNDWQDVLLNAKDTAGNFFLMNLANTTAPRLFGLPIVTTTAITENTALVGAFTPFAQLLRRSDAAVEVSTEHSTFFVENKVAIRAESRLGLAVYRSSAFATITGI